MINRLKIKNYRSHKETEIDFSPGVNVFIGSSDVGKSAILKAIYWAKDNRPLGTSFISSWNKKDSGKTIFEPTEVSIYKDNKILIRRKEQKKNIYLLTENGEEISLEAMKAEVPVEVEDFFNFTEVNICRQLDSHYMLGKDYSGGEISRMFNRLIELDFADDLISTTESQRKEYSSEIRKLEEELLQIDKGIADLSFLQDAEEAIEEIGTLLKRIDSHHEKKILLTNFQEGIRREKERIQKGGNVEEAISILSAIDEEQKKLIQRKEAKENLLSLERERKEYERAIKKPLAAKLEEIQLNLNRLEALYNKLENLEETKTDLLEYKEAIEKNNQSCSFDITLPFYLINTIEGHKEKISFLEKIGIQNLKNYKEKIAFQNKLIQKLNQEEEEIRDLLPEKCPACNGTGYTNK